MGRFLTQKVRMVQCDERRYWHTLDNELYQDDDGTIYIVPRYFKTDNYTIPMFASVLGGSPVDFRVEISHVHDQICYSAHGVYVTLTEEELKEKGYYRFSENRQLWVCEDIPKEFLAKRKFTKKQANDLFWRALCSTNIPKINRIILRVGTVFNVGWRWVQLRNKFVDFDLDRFYDIDYWEEIVPIK
jgi:hypothetical protein